MDRGKQFHASREIQVVIYAIFENYRREGGTPSLWQILHLDARSMF